MSRFNYRNTGLIAAILIVITVFGVQGSGAFAQNAVQATDPSGAAAALGRDDGADKASGVRFVAEEVVQPLPADKQVESPDGKLPLPSPSPSVSDASSLRQLVGAMPVQPALSREMYCLAGAVYFEARGEPLDGQLAVAQVIVNRAESDMFPDDYCGVVTQRKQFSFVRGGHIPSVNRSSPAWKRAKAIAKIAHQALWESKADDALFFHAKYVRPGWARRKVARATIDSHIFYR
ncbi:cell wall hydrolase [Altericroceibacterium spongiae]|uniref:Cell wall hydrolase n=1 Tax=Altericroceibacterium spongiae TaxID=2320269 RepID=A0A420EEE1_9SPHN|nr:cell wall hydrolase [Altericroceibacterium spongiae]RKF19040.1 cell wall hydrolase [Altericroceibacterium spongiae]